MNINIFRIVASDICNEPNNYVFTKLFLISFTFYLNMSMFYYLLLNYSCVFGKRNYRVLVRVSVCVCASVFVCVCVFLHDNSKRNRSRNTKSEYIVVYENSSDEFDIELHRIKVKVTVGVQKFFPFTTIQTVRSYSSTLAQARNLILSMYLHLILIYKMYECRHA